MASHTMDASYTYSCDLGPLLWLPVFLLAILHKSISSVQFSRSVGSDSLQPHGLQHTRLPCPSPTPGACSNSCPSSWWFHPTDSSSVTPFSLCLQSFPASRSFPKSQFFASGGQSIRVVSSVYLRLLIFLPTILIQLVIHPAQHFSWCDLHIN